MTEFNQKEYTMKYRKEHKAQFNVDLNKEEKEELEEILKEKKMKKAEFLRKAIQMLKENKL